MGMAFRSEAGGDVLYVTSTVDDRVLRFDAATWAYLGDFVSSGLGGLDNPRDLLFLPSGDLVVSSSATNEILRYEGTTAAIVALGSAVNDYWIDVDVASATLPGGDPMGCVVGVALQLAWDESSGSFEGMLDADHPVEIMALDATDSVVTAPNGQMLWDAITEMPPGPPPYDMVGTSAAGFLSLVNEGDCSQVGTIRIAFPHSTAGSPRELPVRQIVWQHE